MKPNFALSLTHEKIQLLHRSTVEWRLVGAVDVQAEDLTEQLAMLRRTATGLAPDGVRTKLLIPQDMIRYLTLDTPGVHETARQDAARAALEGATPYAVSDLAFDVQAQGDTTYVAAVAKETLAEAETFAAAHRFNPVSFAADTPEDGFPTEPHFGPTEAAAALGYPDEPPAPEDTAAQEVDNLFVDVPEEEITYTAETGDHTEEISEDDPQPLLLRSDPAPEPEAVDTDPSDTSPGFVSRRTVPTFRTSSPAVTAPQGIIGANDGAVPGFGEDTAGFGPSTSSPTQSQAATVQQSTLPAPAPIISRHASEEERLTVFGAQPPVSIPSNVKRIAMVVAVLILVPIGIAAFASGTLSLGFSRILDGPGVSEPEAQFAAPPQPELLSQKEAPQNTIPNLELASLTPELSDEDAAVLEALQAPTRQDVALPDAPTQDDLQAAYAVTGIWPVAPEVPNPTALIDLEDLYVTSIDPIETNFDAVALPALNSYRGDVAYLSPNSPAPAGTKFTLDQNGMVVPRSNGALNPDGILVFAGPPPVRQPNTLLRIEDPGEDLAMRIVLAAFRPQSRPDDLIESNERATLSGLTRSELALLRPRLRPQSAQESAQENAAAAASLVQLDGDGSGSALIQQPGDENDFDGATARAVAASLRPDARPNNFSAIVERTRKAQAAAPAPAVTTASVAPRAITPKIPSSASTSREATIKNAINLRKVNLIGVYGTPSSRRALVRLGNGRYQKVSVGDRIDGGRVSAIGDAELRYQKRGRDVILKMPKG